MSTADAKTASLPIDQLITPAITPGGYPSSRDSVWHAGARQRVSPTASGAASRASRGTWRSETREPFHIDAPFGASLRSGRSEWSCPSPNGQGAKRARPRLASVTSGTARALVLPLSCGEARAWRPRCRIERLHLSGRSRAELERASFQGMWRAETCEAHTQADRATRPRCTLGPAGGEVITERAGLQTRFTAFGVWRTRGGKGPRFPLAPPWRDEGLIPVVGSKGLRATARSE